MRRGWKPNSAEKAEWAAKEAALTTWLEKARWSIDAHRALTGTVYFTVAETRYRVASHKAGKNFSGEVCFHASPLRAPEIAAALQAGQALDGRGNPKK